MTGNVKNSLLLMVSLLLIALNLRPMLASIGPVMPELMKDTGIGSDAASVLTMAPILCLGVFGFVAPRLSRAFGIERAVAMALALTAIGIALRGVPRYELLLLGTLAGGAGLGVAGVLLPGLVKHHFPRNISLMTGMYTMALSAGAAGAAGLTVPLAKWLGSWSEALAWWALPVLIALLAWLPQARTPAIGAAHQEPGRPRRLLALRGDLLAWQVTLYMGLQSSLAYIVFAWLAPILRERGVDPVTAGAVVGTAVLIQLSTALTAPMLAARRHKQGGISALVILLLGSGILGCMYAPLTTMWMWAAVLGLGQGGAFAIGLALIVFRSPDGETAAELSGMAQGVGYTIAAFGPLFAGLLREWTGGWHATAGLIVGMSLVAVIAGFGAGRPHYVASLRQQT